MMRGLFQGVIPAAVLLLSHVDDARAADAVYSNFAYARLTSLGFASDGWALDSGLVGDSNGVFFGTAYRGGEMNRGTVFRINQDGSGFRVLHHFKGPPVDGSTPFAEVSFGPNGWLYGTTEFGGTNDTGSIFKVRTDGSDYKVVYHFGAAPAHRRPHGHVELGRNGAFFGTAQITGDFQIGAVFTIQPDGSGFRILHEFTSIPNDGADPDSGLTLGSDGLLYGSCSIGGGPGMNGTLFKINEDGTGYTIFHRFASDDPAGEPRARLLEAEGVIYGNASGLIYKVNTDGSGYTRLYTNQLPVIYPYGEVVRGTDGALYWSAQTTNNEALVLSVRSDGSNPRIVASFPLQPVPEGSPTGVAGLPTYGIARGTNGAVLASLPTGIFRVQEDGSDPVVLRHLQHMVWGARQPAATLIRGSDGLFYGTSEAGGFSNAGTIFMLNANGTAYRPIFQFGRGTNTTRVPNRLLEASDGLLYGTTQFSIGNNPTIIFRIARDGTGFGVLKYLNDVNGPRVPVGGLIEGADGWLYGTSSLGGTNGRGAVFKMQKNGSAFTVLRSFATADGSSPSGEFVQAADRTLFGVTQGGGVSNFGTVFRIRPDGSDFARLHDFLGGEDGQRPRAALLLDAQGALFGTASGTGTPVWGTVFRIDSQGNDYQVLHRFAASGIEGRTPVAPLAQGEDNFLYGTTSAGGANGQGTIFRLRKDGTHFTVLWNFPAFQNDGQAPVAGLTSAGDGSFLGATRMGGDYANGTVFRFDGTVVRLSIANLPPVELSWPASSTTDQLEYSASVFPAEWHPVPWQPVRAGPVFKIAVPSDNPAPFFRLRREWK